MNLWQKIVEVRKIVDSLEKDKDSYGYSYVSGNQILEKIQAKMNELQLILQPSTKEGVWSTHDYTTNNGKQNTDFIVHGQGGYTWINAEDPKEREFVEWAYYGQQDDISKAYGSALTYSERYFLLKYFNAPTDADDPDARKKDNHSGNKKRDYAQELIDLATKKGITVKQILATYKQDFGKEASEVKYITKEGKKALTDKLNAMPDKG